MGDDARHGSDPDAREPPRISTPTGVPRPLMARDLERLETALAEVGKDAAAAARRASRIEAAVARMDSVPPARKPQPTHPEAWADSSQRVEHVGEIVKHALEETQLASHKQRDDRRFTVNVAILSALSTGLVAFVVRLLEVAFRGHW